jgi:hypothetical protein
MHLTTTIEGKNGAIALGWEAPDTLNMQYVGEIDAWLVGQSSLFTRPIYRGVPYAFILLDISRLASVSQDGRRAMAASEHAHLLRGTAVIGASFHFRAISGLIMRATMLMGRRVDNPQHFVDTEAAGRAWIAERRRTLAAELRALQ